MKKLLSSILVASLFGLSGCPDKELEKQGKEYYCPKVCSRAVECRAIRPTSEESCVAQCIEGSKEPNLTKEEMRQMTDELTTLPCSTFVRLLLEANRGN